MLRYFLNMPSDIQVKSAGTITATENSTKTISNRWEKYEPKKPRQCSYCGRRDGHNTCNRPKKNSTASSTLPSPTSKVASIDLDLPTLTLEPPSASSLMGNGDVEFVPEKQAEQILAQRCFLASHQNHRDGSRWQLRIPCCGSYHTR